MEEERDIVVFSDEEGNEFELEAIDYFEHEGVEYAVLVDPEEPEDEDAESEVYIMKIVTNGDVEEFLPADEDKLEELIKIVEHRFECECDCDECEGECEHEHESCGCGCGCHD